MAYIYVKCGTGIASFVLHSVSSSSYPKTITSSSWSVQTGFAAGSYDCYIDTIVYESGYSDARVSTEWASSGTTNDWSIISDRYIATRADEARYVEVYAKKTTTTKYRITLQCSTGISRIYFTYYYNGTQYSSSTDGTVSFSADYGTNVNIYDIDYETYYTNAYIQTGTNGWYWEEDDDIYVSGTRTATFTASRKTYTITYNANGGNNPPAKQTFLAGTSTTLSSTIPTRSGYTFLGWATYANADSPMYSYGETVRFGTNTTLYAVWEEMFKTYYGRITLNANGGQFPGTGYTSISWPISGVLSGTGTTAATVSTNLPLSTGSYQPYRDGYTFLGWSKSSGATSATYESGDEYSFSATSTSSSSPTISILYAIWSKITISAFTYHGTDSIDNSLFAVGLEVSSALTATAWNRLKAKIDEVSGGWSYSNVSSGQIITAEEFNDVRTAIATLDGAGTLPSSISTGRTIKASYFVGSGSLKSAINSAINSYNA